MAQAASYPFDKWNFQVFINIEKYNVLFKIRKYYIRIIFVLMAISQPAFTCSKLNLFKVSNNNTTTSSLMFNHSNAFIFNFEHILILALIIYLSPRFTHFSSMFRFNIPLNNWFSKVFQGCSKEHCPEMASCFQQSASL